MVLFSHRKPKLQRSLMQHYTFVRTRQSKLFQGWIFLTAQCKLQLHKFKLLESNQKRTRIWNLGNWKYSLLFPLSQKIVSKKSYANNQDFQTKIWCNQKKSNPYQYHNFIIKYFPTLWSLLNQLMRWWRTFGLENQFLTNNYVQFQLK